MHVGGKFKSRTCGLSNRVEQGPGREKRCIPLSCGAHTQERRDWEETAQPMITLSLLWDDRRPHPAFHWTHNACLALEHGFSGTERAFPSSSSEEVPVYILDEKREHTQVMKSNSLEMPQPFNISIQEQKTSQDCQGHWPAYRPVIKEQKLLL